MKKKKQKQYIPLEIVRENKIEGHYYRNSSHVRVKWGVTFEKLHTGEKASTATQFGHANQSGNPQFRLKRNKNLWDKFSM